jgi:hypothetical protein
MVRTLLFVALALALCGCTAKPDERAKAPLDELAASAPAAADEPTGSIVSTAPRALALLPPDAGQPRAVAQRAFSDGIAQDVVYDRALPGLNESRIELRIRTERRLDGVPLALEKPTESSIRAELALQFPRMTMQVVDRPMRNAYGPYGLAIGRWANGTRCIYAWQWIDAIPGNPAEAAANPASIRIRLCRSASLDQMAAFVDRLRIEPGPYERRDRSVATFNSPAPPTIARANSTARRERSRPVSRNMAASVPQPARAPDVVKPDERDGNQPLDPSLPAAAYRGPAPGQQARAPAAH